MRSAAAAEESSQRNLRRATALTGKPGLDSDENSTNFVIQGYEEVVVQYTRYERVAARAKAVEERKKGGGQSQAESGTAKKSRRRSLLTKDTAQLLVTDTAQSFSRYKAAAI